MELRRSVFPICGLAIGFHSTIKAHRVQRGALHLWYLASTERPLGRRVAVKHCRHIRIRPQIHLVTITQWRRSASVWARALLLLQTVGGPAVGSLQRPLL